MLGNKYTSAKGIIWVIDNILSKSFVLTSSDGRYALINDLDNIQEIINQMDYPDVIEQIFEDLIGGDI